MADKGLLIFDMDGVLVDVTDSYRAAIQADTVQHFTGTEITNEKSRTAKTKAAGMTIGCSPQHIIREDRRRHHLQRNGRLTSSTSSMKAA